MKISNGNHVLAVEGKCFNLLLFSFYLRFWNIQRRRFDDALTILDKLMKGLQAPSNSRFEHLVGVTYHNIGLIHMSQGNFGDALENFKRAVVVRTQCLPANHPDIAVGSKQYMRSREFYCF